MDNNYVNGRDIPIGLGMALAKDFNAMSYFASLDDAAKRRVIDQTHSIRSKEEMEYFVSRLGKSDSFT